MEFTAAYWDPKDESKDWKYWTFNAIDETAAMNYFKQQRPDMKLLAFVDSDDPKTKEMWGRTVGIDAIEEARKFASGAMRGSDKGKENYIGAVSWTALKRVTEYQNKAEKKGGYEKGHWKLGIPIEELEKSLMRHLQKYFANKYEDANLEPEVDHLAAAYFNLQAIIHEEEKANTRDNKGN